MTTATGADVRVVNVSRRDLLKGLLGAGGLVLGVQLFPGAARAAMGAGGALAETFAPDLFLSIDASGLVSIVAHRSEMGTGIRTSLPMVLADELEADWERVTLTQAPGDAAYGDQNTDGSRSVRQFFGAMRQIGATARTMLESAAARAWNVDASECAAQNHEVVHGPSGRSIGFGDLVPIAAVLDTPDAAAVRLKDPSEWRYIGGKGVPLADGRDIVTGKAGFGLDVVLEGMKFATIERCPVLGGAPKSFDDAETLAVPGVERVVPVPGYQGAPAFSPVGGLAVIGRDTWSVLQGRNALEVEWEEGEHASYDSRLFRRDLEREVRKTGQVVRNRGDVDTALAAADTTLEAEYYCPHLAHAPMEPPCAVARVADGKCEVWAPTQSPQTARASVAQALGLRPVDVTIHVTLLGGGFGRKSKPDYIVEAAVLAAVIEAPVKLVWTREDDIRHDYYHSVSAQHYTAGLDADGKLTAWRARTAFPPIGSTFNPASQLGIGEAGQGVIDMPYDVPNIRCEVGAAQGHVRIGWLRSVANVYHAFACSSFVDEIAHARGLDPLDNLLDLLGPQQHVDLDGARYGNYGGSPADHPIDTGRFAHVVRLAAEKSGWGTALGPGRGRGLAVHRSFLCYVAVVAQVEVQDDGSILIPRIDMAVDAGQLIHPDRVVAQMEGAAVFGASLALTGEITAKGGAIEQGNFDDYTIVRMNRAPREVAVHLVESHRPPGGVGEPGVPPIAPALCNAVFAATGQRIRSLPLSRHDLKRS